MFQYATLKSIANHKGYDYMIPSSNFKDPWNDHQLFEIFELSSLTEKNIGRKNQKVFQESYFHFDANLYNNCPDNIDLLGYFQSEKYFTSIKDAIKKDFTFKQNILILAKEYRKQIGEDDVISLHIRRGDYLDRVQHGCQSLEYYEKALSLLPDNLNVIIFSDDPKWVLQQKLFESDRFFVSEDNSNGFDLCLMTLCNYHVIANSSFSWWGAWLANSKKVIAPKRWFGPPLDKQNNTKDLLPEGWIEL